MWAGVDSAWEQENAEARKMLENAAESHTSGARFVRRFLFNNHDDFVMERLLIEMCSNLTRQETH